MPQPRKAGGRPRQETATQQIDEIGPNVPHLADLFDAHPDDDVAGRLIAISRTTDAGNGRKQPPPAAMACRGERVACIHCGEKPELPNRADRRAARRNGLPGLTLTVRHRPWCPQSIGGGRPGGGRRG